MCVCSHVCGLHSYPLLRHKLVKTNRETPSEVAWECWKRNGHRCNIDTRYAFLWLILLSWLKKKNPHSLVFLCACITFSPSFLLLESHTIIALPASSVFGMDRKQTRMKLPRKSMADSYGRHDQVLEAFISPVPWESGCPLPDYFFIFITLNCFWSSSCQISCPTKTSQSNAKYF